MKCSVGISDFLAEISSLPHSIVFLCFFALFTLKGFLISPSCSSVQFTSIQLLSCVWLFTTPWTVACQASCPSPTHRIYSNSYPLSWWCHPTVWSSVVPFSSRLQYFPASRSPLSQFFASSGQHIGVSSSASVHPMTIHDGFPLG